MKNRLVSLFVVVLLLTAIILPQSIEIGASGIPQDIILMIDTSNSMIGQPTQDAKQAATSFCKSILRQNPSSRIAILRFNNACQALTGFTGDQKALVDKIDKIDSGGGTNMEAAFRKAKDLFIKEARIGVKKTIVLLSDGNPTVGTTTDNPSFYPKDTYGQYCEYANFVRNFVKSGKYGEDNMSTLRGTGVSTFVYDSIWTVYFSKNPSGSPEDQLGRQLLKDLSDGNYYSATDGLDIDWTLSAISQSVISDSPFEREHVVHFDQTLSSDLPKKASVTVPWRTDFFTKKPSSFNKELALTCMAFSTAAYDNRLEEDVLTDFGFLDVSTQHPQSAAQNHLDINSLTCRPIGRLYGDDPAYAEEKRDIEMFYEANGLQYDEEDIQQSIALEIQSILYGGKFTMAHQLVGINGEVKHLFALVARGSKEQSDWNANFSAGINVITDGTHVGFSKAAEVVEEQFTSYMSKYQDDKYENLILITGHSKGAAVSNIVAKRLSEKDSNTKENLYAYTFATPNTVGDWYNRGDYPNIHNVVNYRDLVCYMPPGSTNYGNLWGYEEVSDDAIKEIIKMTSTLTKDPGSQQILDDTKRIFTEGGTILDGDIRYDVYHHPITYLALLKSTTPEVYRSEKATGYIIHFHCPINAEVLADDKVIAKFTNNRAYSTASNVLAFVDGDSKYVILPSGPEYEIRFTAYDIGTMTYGVIPVNHTEVEEAVYKNIQLEKDKQFITHINDGLKLFDGKKAIGDVSTDGTETLYNGAKQTAVATENSPAKTTSRFAIKDIVYLTLLVISFIGNIFLIIVYLKTRKNKNQNDLQNNSSIE